MSQRLLIDVKEEKILIGEKYLRKFQQVKEKAAAAKEMLIEFLKELCGDDEAKTYVDAIWQICDKAHTAENFGFLRDYVQLRRSFSLSAWNKFYATYIGNSEEEAVDPVNISSEERSLFVNLHGKIQALQASQDPFLCVTFSAKEVISLVTMRGKEAYTAEDFMGSVIRGLWSMIDSDQIESALTQRLQEIRLEKTSKMGKSLASPPLSARESRTKISFAFLFGGEEKSTATRPVSAREGKEKKEMKEKQDSPSPSRKKK